MSEPLAICIEDLDATDPDEQYVRCVALPGLDPGLGVTGEGQVVWQMPTPDGCELCVSADDRLLLWRPDGAETVWVRRAGRALEVPVEKPVILLDQDEIDIGARRFRIHVHGKAPAVHPPSPLRTRAVGTVATLAAAVALGGPVAGCDKLTGKGETDIEIREAPPAIAEPEPVDAGVDASKQPDAAASASATASATGQPGTSASASTKKPQTTQPIEVRPSPPRMAPPDNRPTTEKK